MTATVRDFLDDRARRAAAAGIPPRRIVLDAGLDLGKTPEQSLTLLRSSATLAGLGHPLLLSASNKTFLGAVLGLEIDDRREASLAAAALGVSLGCRVVRVHDVAGTVRVRDVLAAVSEAGAITAVPEPGVSAAVREAGVNGPGARAARSPAPAEPRAP